VACGRLDGFWEFHLKPWDMAAGVLMVTEAGGKVTACDGGRPDIYKPEIAASNGHIHEAMLEVLKLS
jgi:myo-inositol-1(or 4)-monophosphatase